MNKKISVIVPAYNAEQTIFRCLSSIQNQTYGNLEIIVVNDGSTDGTLRIAQKLSDEDDRIRVIDVANGGVSRARNIGLDNASGDFITFVDADDYIDKEMYFTLVQTIHKFGADIAHCSYKNVDSNGVVISEIGGNGEVVVQTHDEAIECLLTGSLFVGSLWNKLYKAEYFDVRLDETIKFNEDILLNFLLFDKACKSVFIDNPYYNYVAVENSSTHSADAVVACTQMLEAARRMCRLSKGKSYERLAENRIAFILLELYRAFLFSNVSLKSEQAEAVYEEILSFKSKGFYQSKRDRLVVFFYRFMPRTFKLLYRMYDKIRVKKLDPK